MSKKYRTFARRTCNNQSIMQVIKKTFEYFTADKYRDMDYGTIYYVAGDGCPEINDYVLTQLDQLIETINRNELNWITCKIVYLDANNHLFNTRKKATLYSPILPFEGSPEEANIFFAAYLDIAAPGMVEEALSEYFSTLQQMLDEILDTGYYREYHLRNTILSATDDDCCSSATQSRDAGIRFSVGVSEPLPFTEPSRLMITPYPYQILLPDYNLEFRFGAQVKALYILFLKHSEGISMNEIYDYQEEFSQLYLSFSNRSNVDRLRKGVANLFDVFSPNAMNVKKSQCNSTIRNVIPNEDLYRHYIIEAVRGERHKINLDRSLVSMPEDLRS